MKKSILLLALLAFSYNSANAQWWQGNKEIDGNGKMTKETRNVGSYDEVSLLGSMDVELVAGKEGRLEIEAEENLLEYIVTEVKGDQLKISTKKGYNLDPSRNMKLKVTVPVEEISSVSLVGSGDIYSTRTLKAENFEASLTGSGNIKLPVEAANARANVTGSGDIELKGSATDFQCNVTGSGDIAAFEFKCQNVKATLIGSGDIQVYASEVLKATIPGAGDIEYKGNPKKEDFKTMGIGSISKR
ncbi:head GIN domain-containing protein [Salinimicrobium soli]|uniref:head GIN domain-containing protein n=1 Tax=Salinimicrobium soli TaxID=1254399 RepID=UPI003AAE500E